MFDILLFYISTPNSTILAPRPNGEALIVVYVLCCLPHDLRSKDATLASKNHGLTCPYIIVQVGPCYMLLVLVFFVQVDAGRTSCHKIHEDLL